jgi:hypothetical protein
MRHHLGTDRAALPLLFDLDAGDHTDGHMSWLVCCVLEVAEEHIALARREIHEKTAQWTALWLRDQDADDLDKAQAGGTGLAVNQGIECGTCSQPGDYDFVPDLAVVLEGEGGETGWKGGGRLVGVVETNDGYSGNLLCVYS